MKLETLSFWISHSEKRQLLPGSNSEFVNLGVIEIFRLWESHLLVGNILTVHKNIPSNRRCGQVIYSHWIYAVQIISLSNLSAEMCRIRCSNDRWDPENIWNCIKLDRCCAWVGFYFFKSHLPWTKYMGNSIWTNLSRWFRLTLMEASGTVATQPFQSKSSN